MNKEARRQALQHAMGHLVKMANPLGAAVTMGVGGGLYGAYKNYSNARESGADVGTALREGARGAAIGTAAGGAAGAGLGAVAPGAAGAVSRFGQRQLHSLTGWKPSGGLHSIRAGAYDARQALHGAQQSAHELGHFDNAMRGAPHSLTDESMQRLKALSPTDLAAHRTAVNAQLGKAQRAASAAERAEQMGLTSIPGVVKSIKNHGLVPTAVAGAAEQWHSGSNLDKALSFGLPAYGMANAIRGNGDPSLGQAEGVGQQAGEVVGGLVGAPLPFIGQMALQEGMGRIGKGVGKLVDRVRGTTAQETTLCSKLPRK